MRQISDGCFACEEEMSNRPGDLKISRWALPATLGRAEPEEAAARILHFSQQLNTWVGVSWPRLVQMMKEEYEAHERFNAANEQRYREREQKVRRYMVLCILTLGIYALFAPKPTEVPSDLPADDLPFTGIFPFGPQHVVTGVQELLRDGLIRSEVTAEGEEGIQVFFPTCELVRRILKAQSFPGYQFS
ncbi:MAG: hypothetical protein HYZ63_01210 [Candidatus Andersenbacteria bacterium]|nr:hypothetical protein [Candidatus Andersenbacteria bacterium]